jgi:hypothetical protein
MLFHLCILSEVWLPNFLRSLFIMVMSPFYHQCWSKSPIWWYNITILINYHGNGWLFNGYSSSTFVISRLYPIFG